MLGLGICILAVFLLPHVSKQAANPKAEYYKCRTTRKRGRMMKAVILADELGTRFSEETNLRPKPMIGIWGKAVLWHIMKIYAAVK